MFRTPLTLDRTHRSLTILVGAILVAGFVVAAVTGRALGVGAVVSVAAALGLAWAMGPRELVVEGGELRVERRAWRPLRVPLAEVTSASPLSSLGARPLRLLGVGGFFGSYGLFWSRSLGRFRLYATRQGQAVLVRRGEGALPLVLTPDDVAGTIEALDPRPRA